MRQEDKLMLCRILEDFAHEQTQLQEISNKYIHALSLLAESTIKMQKGKPITLDRIQSEFRGVEALLKYQSTRWTALSDGLDKINQNIKNDERDSDKGSLRG